MSKLTSQIKESLFQTITKLEENQKIETEFKQDANLLIAKQKLSRIDSFTGYFDFMHNNFQTPVYYEGILYPSVTHAYHAARSTDERTRRAILNSETFQILGNIAIRIEDPPDWQEKKVKIMEQLLRDKFRRSKELQEKLRTTEHRELVMTYQEEKKNNLYWGVVKGKGQNQLGRILMRIRDDLIQDKVLTPNPVEILNWVNTSFKLVGDLQFIPEIKLTVNKANKTIDHIVLKNKSIYKIGQFPQCDLNLAHPSISRLHAIIVVDESLGVILIDLRSKGGTKLDGDLLKDNIPYRLKTGKKINFALSTRDYIVELDLTRVKKVYEKEQMKLNNNLNLLQKLDLKAKDAINKTFGVNTHKNENNDTIFVKNIPFNAGEEKLKEIFEENFGKVISMYWPKEHETGFKMNYAFIQFDSPKSAKEAVDYGLIAYEDDDKETDFLGGNNEKRSYMLKISYALNTQKYSKKLKQNQKKDSRYESSRNKRKSRSRSKRSHGHRHQKDSRSSSSSLYSSSRSKSRDSSSSLFSTKHKKNSGSSSSSSFLESSSEVTDKIDKEKVNI